MEIGRKIYYELATGNVIQDTGERSGDVIQTTIEQDFVSYISLQERLPNSVGCIQLEYGQYANEFLLYSLRINPTTLELIWIPRNNGTIEDAKTQKIKQLNEFCNAAILTGFTSNALGTQHSYDFDYDAQINLGGMLNAITAGLISEQSVTWKASGLPQPHTFAQFKEVFGAGLTHKNTNIGKYWALKAQVEAATIPEEVEAVRW
ncbi:DUF4376 domain-containing protein [Paenibacillus chondroitinus]|uniref:DUF4376 domain-containing protein n=1 Tax=Paenibacillus chondroitinus TaxID=59842 RepID=A0ABU6D714_9BACL|nr:MULTISPECIES: DUF4376 domain-containing protein [Paenibacillus]MCY9658107.1 DUF4376 domain-containing protein [Paenibacillus anseongense]MEB4793231.1 DUF4376 domain-containing protein [Paenibacillus chondroitinus]